MRHALTEAEQSVVVADEKWQELARRRERNGVAINELAKMVGLTREQLGKILRGEVPGSRSLGKIERALEELEEEAGQHVSELRNGNGSNLVKFTIHGVYGAAEVIVEGPIENMAELQAAVDRLLRGQHSPEGGAPNR